MLLSSPWGELFFSITPASAGGYHNSPKVKAPLTRSLNKYSGYFWRHGLTSHLLHYSTMKKIKQREDQKMSGLIYTILTGPNFGWAFLQPVTKITDINKYRLNFYVTSSMLSCVIRKANFQCSANAITLTIRNFSSQLLNTIQLAYPNIITTIDTKSQQQINQDLHQLIKKPSLLTIIKHII